MDFNELRKRYEEIEKAYRSGVMDANQYQRSANDLMMQDSEGKNWTIQLGSGHWMVFMDGQWVRQEPPIEKTVPIQKEETSVKEKSENKHTDMSAFFIYRNGINLGPYTRKQLKEIFLEGGIQKKDLFFCIDSNRWISYQEALSLLETEEKTAGPMPSPPAKKKPLKKSHLLLAVTIPILTLVLLISGLSLYFFLPVERSKEIGSFVASPQGASFDHEALKIEISEASGSFRVTEVQKSRQRDEDILYRSATYFLEGALHEIQGDLRITMPLPSNVLDHEYEDMEQLSDNLYIVMEEEIFNPYWGPSTHETILESRIDKDAKTIFAVIELDAHPSIASDAKTLLASKAPLVIAQQDESAQSQKIGFYIVQTWGWSSVLSPKGHFRIRYKEEIAQENLKILLDIAEEQKEIIERLGFRFDRRTKYPIMVELEEGLRDYGQYQGSQVSNQKGKILLSHALIAAAPPQDHADFSWPTVRVTFGHELMHLAQQLYDARSSFFKNETRLAEQPFLWLDEAIATWYEPYALGRPDYLSPNAKENIEFIHTPFFDPGTTTIAAGMSREAMMANWTGVSRHGYGASLFFRYLTFRDRNHQIPSRIYDVIAAQSSWSQNAAYAVLDVMTSDEHSGLMWEEWPNFLEVYFNSPERIAGELDTTALLTNRKFSLKAQKGPGSRSQEEDVTFFFEAQGRSVVAHELTAKGSLQEKEPAVMRLSFTQKNLTAQGVLIGIDANSREFFEEPGRLTVNVENSGEGGVLVYKIDQNGNRHRVAGAPRHGHRYLCSSHELWEPNPEAVIERFGSSGESFSQILIVPFNNDPLSSKDCLIDIEIVYEPEDLEELQFSLWELTYILEDLIDLETGHGLIDVESYVPRSITFLIFEEEDLMRYYVEALFGSKAITEFQYDGTHLSWKQEETWESWETRIQIAADGQTLQGSYNVLYPDSHTGSGRIVGVRLSLEDHPDYSDILEWIELYKAEIEKTRKGTEKTP